MRKLFFLLLICGTSSLIQAQRLQTEQAHAEVSGSAPGTPYTGKSDQLKGTLDIQSGEVDFRIPLKSIKTGKNKRDDHMNEALETDKYPEATFKGKITSGFDPQKKEKQNLTLHGDFTIHGVTKNIDIKGTARPEGEKVNFSAEWTIDITDYDIEPPKVLTVKVNPEHTITVSGTLNK